jgi:hypothetical protein
MKRYIWIAIIASALGFFVDLCDIIILSIVRKSSLALRGRDSRNGHSARDIVWYFKSENWGCEWCLGCGHDCRVFGILGIGELGRNV